MPGLKKNLNLLVNYDPSNGVIQPEQLLQEVRMRHIQADFSWQPSFFR